jgi:hypothetical protein
MPKAKKNIALLELSQESFESIFVNEYGFESAKLQLGPGEIWGTDDDEVFITQLQVDLDAVEDSYSLIDKEFGNPYFNISYDFGDMLSLLFGIFYNEDHFEEFTELAEVKKVNYSDGWQPTGVIIMHLHYVEDGVEKTYSIMEDARDWESEQNFLITNSWQYINYCHERFERFKDYA